MRYAIVDIETTGGSPKNSRITEIAIYLHDGNHIIDQFTTLINPDVYISSFITSLTGITNDMVANAPRFYEIAKNIVQITEGAMFVAHNAAFDYGFVQAEFKALGYDYSRETLCTVKLARKLIPGHKSYSLGNLCADLNININGRHRAAGDALATTKLFDILLAQKPIVGANAFLPDEYGSLHPNLDLPSIKNITQQTGIYYLHNQQGDVLYIGHGRNLRSSVLGHLTEQKNKRAQALKELIASVSVEVTGSLLVALLLEQQELHKHKPTHNRITHRRIHTHGIFSLTNANGYICFVIRTLKKSTSAPLITFASLSDTLTFLSQLADKHDLCHKLCGIQNPKNNCLNYEIALCKGACIDKEPVDNYNQRAREALYQISIALPSMLLIDNGRFDDEHVAVAIQNGQYLGYIYFDPNYTQTPEQILESITLKNDILNSVHIITHYLSSHKVEQIVKI